MKAVVVSRPGEAKVVELPSPTEDESGTLLRVRYVGLCGTDLNTFRGRNPMVQYPRIIGHEVSATVCDERSVSGNAFEYGQNVTLSPYTACGVCSSCKAGRVNACQVNKTLGVQRDGALKELHRHPSDRLYSGKLSLEELCLVEPLTIGFHAVARGRIKPDDSVAVFGCGGVGLGAISGAAYRGARVIAIDVDDEKLETARLAGAVEVINSKTDLLHSSLDRLTDGSGSNCVIEAIGLPDTFRAAVEEVSFAGRVVYIGYAKEPVAYQTKLFVQKELDIVGSRNALHEDFTNVIQMLEAKRFPVRRAISTTITIEDVPDMLRLWSENPSRYTKIMVQVS